MKARLIWLAAFGAVLMLGVTLGYLQRGAGRGGKANRASTPSAPAAEPSTTAAPGETPTQRPAVAPLSPLAAALEGMLERLVRGGVSAAELAAFKRALLAADPAETIAAIRAFLATGRNAGTGQGFNLATGGGTLEGAPTLRLLLLDVLGLQARKLRSPESAIIARAILETKE